MSSRFEDGPLKLLGNPLKTKAPGYPSYAHWSSVAFKSVFLPHKFLKFFVDRAASPRFIQYEVLEPFTRPGSPPACCQVRLHIV